METLTGKLGDVLGKLGQAFLNTVIIFTGASGLFA